MSVRLALLGIDAYQRQWLAALAALRALDEIELAGIGHHTLAAARDTADAWKHLTGGSGGVTGAGAGEHGAAGAAGGAVFDDPRVMLKELGAQAILVDRPQNVPLEFLVSCVEAGVALFSLGPLVESLAEAQALAAVLGGSAGGRSRLLYCFPRFVDGPALKQCAQADDFIRPIRFAAATWLGVNVAMVRGKEGGVRGGEVPVRSLSVLMWDALDAVIGLMGMPTSVFAAIKGTVGSGNSFADVSGAVTMTLRFGDESAASVSVCDWVPMAPRGGREILLWGAGGTLRVDEQTYEYRDAEGALIDSRVPPVPMKEAPLFTQVPGAQKLAEEALRGFLKELEMPVTPQSGWELRLEEIAATMEAVVVSHRTGQPESPERFRTLRR